MTHVKMLLKYGPYLYIYIPCKPKTSEFQGYIRYPKIVAENLLLPSFSTEFSHAAALVPAHLGFSGASTPGTQCPTFKDSLWEWHLKKSKISAL